MATIRPSVYVGLGGTGILAISYAKKLFEQAYGKGNIPEQIAFAAIDFDLSAPDSTSLATDMHDDFLSLYVAASPKQLYDAGVKRGEYQWMFGSNIRYIGERISDGASQVRTYGRFLSEMIQDNIIRRLRDCILQVKSIQNEHQNETQNQPIDIHIAMSLAGGTGCGSFLNVAQLIRNEFGNQVNIIGYGVIHSVFRAMDSSCTKSPRVVANAYSAVLDLDYLMGASDENPVKVTLNGKAQELRQPIYDEFYIVDNETERGKKVGHISKLCEVIGTCLFAGSSDLGTKVQGFKSNNHWKLGNYNISPKLGWVQSLGACQVVYKGELLAEIYGLKAAVNLIQNMQVANIDASSIANAWAKEEAKIKEDEGNDQLIDSIYNLKKENIGIAPLDIKDSISEIKSAVEKYINGQPNFPSEKSIAERIKELTEMLQTKTFDMLQHQQGVGNALDFLDALRRNVTIYRNEMETELALFEKQADDKKIALQTEYKEYEDYSKKLFKSKSKQAELLEDGIGKIAKNILTDKLEALRRKVATEIFTSILSEINTLYSHIDELNRKLTALLKEYQDTLSEKVNSSESSLVFEYDLSIQERNSMVFTPESTFYDDYFTSLKKSLFDVNLEKELGTSILDYCNNLRQAQAYKDKLLVDVINELDEKEYNALKIEITEKSSRLLRLDDRGQVIPTMNNALPTTKMVNIYLVSVFQREGVKNRLEQDKTFLNNLGIEKEYIHSDFESMKQKMIFYRSDMAILPYCISAFNEHTIEREYTVLLKDAMNIGSTSFNPHCDKQLFEQMRAIDFKLKPEMKNEAEFYWICGHLFGWSTFKEQQYIMEKDNNKQPLKIDHKEDIDHTKFVRCFKGKYQIWNEDGNTMSLDGKWESLDNTGQRDKAFNYFKTIVFPEIKQTLHAKIYNDLQTKGLEYYKLQVKGIIADGLADYIDKVACTDKNSLTYFAKQGSGDTQRFLEEWNYIERDLINALENFK